MPKHWEGDLIRGLSSLAINTLVERTTRFTLLLHLPRVTGYENGSRLKNGPALADHGAEAVRNAVTRPEQLRQSLTRDQGAEMALYANLRINTDLQIYFYDPQSPWQRGTNENTSRGLGSVSAINYKPTYCDDHLNQRSIAPTLTKSF